jgi:hypothetical protein
MTQLERALYAAKAHITGGLDDGASRTERAFVSRPSDLI